MSREPPADEPQERRRWLASLVERIRQECQGDDTLAELELASEQLAAQLSRAFYAEQFCAAVQEKGEWAGAPALMPDVPLVLEPRYPYQKLQGRSWENLGQEPAAEAPDPLAELGGAAVRVVNRWTSWSRQAEVTIYDVGGRRRVGWVQANTALHRWSQSLGTLSGYQVWDVAAELKAMRKLQELVTPAQWACYVLTGGFLERSRRSQATYWFRRLRPTVAMLPRGGPAGNIGPAVCLCLHPVGYYEGTFAGALVPTDDVLAHVLLARGDEHEFWKRANHIPITEPNSGL